MQDLIIRGGTVVDGTGAAPVTADVAVKNGRVTAVGKVTERATREIDASGAVVAPGFVDIHTHYDAQVTWDPMLTPSSLHGVTTAIGGNCGFTLAPVTPEAAAYLVPMLARVEGMPIESLTEALHVDWDTFAAYLARLENQVALNVGFLVGHSTLRQLVMGQDAIRREATADEVAAMTALLRESLASGALGFSSTRSQSHSDHEGTPVPSRWASVDELVELSREVGQHPGTTLELIPSIDMEFDMEAYDAMARMSAAANRPLNWNLLSVRPGEAEARYRANKLGASDYARERGGRVIALMLPQVSTLRLSFLAGMLYDTLPGWSDVMALRPEARLKALRDTAVRDKLRAGAADSPRAWANWADTVIADAAAEKLQPYVGRRVGDIAAEQNKDPFDALLDLACEDELRLGLMPPVLGGDDASWAERVRLCGDDRVVLGGSDAGAHLDMIDTFACQTTFLKEAVRDRGLISLEQAIHHLTDEPARLYGLRDRGRIAVGGHADLIVFDRDEVGPGNVTARADLPAGGWRLTSDPTGMHHVIVNGTPIVEDNKATGALPGHILRSGQDTDTVEARA
ncbi:amidohydrolase family protein [Streptomyces sp. NPDC046821]|uniref:N-acyl-D-amino-acid deacylase family protein n=1 Tax=Streptomyces sp. NPDC046821 TaxID=3154702 RepID=UPI0033D5AA34